jgi:DNA-binding LacI/PurR family transcriptional regulator
MNIHVLDRTGHTTHEWDSSKPDEVEAARTLFTTLTGKGYRAFLGGESGKRMDRFDPEAEEMTLVPQLQGG